MTQLPSSSWVNTSEAPCWLPHAVTWERRSTIVLTRWIRAPQRLPCHGAKCSICLETQYGCLGCVLHKTPGEPLLASQLSLVALSLIFQCEAALCREGLKKEMCFHERLKGMIKHALFSAVIQHFDTFIVLCLIYGSQPHILFLKLFFSAMIVLTQYYLTLLNKTS